MTKTSKLEKGAQVETNYSGRWTRHEIIERRESPAGVALKVKPYVPRSTGGWIGADAFRPAGQRRIGRKAKIGLAAAGVLVAISFYFGLPQMLYGWAVLSMCRGGSVLAQSCR